MSLQDSRTTISYAPESREDVTMLQYPFEMVSISLLEFYTSNEASRVPGSI
jgi:hypothetical protein